MKDVVDSVVELRIQVLACMVLDLEMMQVSVEWENAKAQIISILLSTLQLFSLNILVFTISLSLFGTLGGVRIHEFCT